MGSEAEFEVTAYRDSVVVQTEGSLKGRGADALASVVDGVLTAGRTRVIVDLIDATHFGEQAERVLASAADAAVKDGRDFIVLQPTASSPSTGGPQDRG